MSLEESVPCALFDLGLHYYGDQEGNGRLQTHQLGASFAAAPVFRDDRHNGTTNLRIGGSFFWSQKRIDFTKLVFSDQLDAKYGIFDRLGNLNPTSFVAPNKWPFFSLFYSFYWCSVSVCSWF